MFIFFLFLVYVTLGVQKKKDENTNGNGKVKYIVTDLVHTYDPRPNKGHVDLGMITIQLIDKCIAYFEQGLEFLN